MAFLRRAGRFLENVGVSLQDKNAYVERRTSPRGPPPVGSASPTPSPNGRFPHPPCSRPFDARCVSARQGAHDRAPELCREHCQPRGRRAASRARERLVRSDDSRLVDAPPPRVLSLPS